MQKVIRKCECGENMELKVLMSAAGYYVGFECNQCGPYSRITGYFESKEDATEELDFLVERLQ
jgi:hypothetical protein